MARTIHTTFAIDYLERLPDAELAKVFVYRHLDKPVSADVVRAYLAELRAEGKTMVPVCDHADADGGCAGHEIPDETEVICG
jgi:hypothetical protein